MEPTRKSYPSDVSDAERELLAPYPALVRADAPQRVHGLRAVFDVLRYVVQTGCQWDYLPYDFPPHGAVYQQARRWPAAGGFEAAAHGRRAVLRLAAEREVGPSAVVFDGRTIQSTAGGGRGTAATGGGTGRRCMWRWTP